MLGPSGSGKTTTLRLIAGFERPDEGRIELGGADVSRLPPYARDVNTVFQDYALFPHMTVEKNVSYGLRQRGVDVASVKKRTAEMLNLVGMTDFAVRYPPHGHHDIVHCPVCPEHVAPEPLPPLRRSQEVN